MIKAIIYDLDDLMVRSDEAHIKAEKILLEKYHKDYDKIPQEMLANFVGRRVIDICKEMVNFFKLEISPEKFYQERTDIFLELAKTEIQAMPGLQESLDFFKNNSYTIAIASSGAKKYIKIILDKFKINEYFDVIITGDDVKIGKPDPETYSVAVKKLQLKPNECLVLEDATNGIKSAKAAVCYCLAIYNPHTEKQDLSEADKILNSLNDITLDLIKSF